MTAQMTPALPDPTVAASNSALEAFMDFPAPLAILGLNGSLELVNTSFVAWFSVDGLDAVKLRAFASNPDGTWQDVHLSSGAAGSATVRARAVRTSNRILLIVDDPNVSRDGDLEALRARIGDLEQVAATDYLTGAWNRAHLDRVIESELARSTMSRLPLTLALFDIDHFKNINDAFGHATGDSVLRKLVQLVRNHIRSSDVLFRWGGEEFVVLVSSAGYRRAEIMAETLRQFVAGHPFEGVGSVTISIGVAEHNGDESADAWFRRLDEAVYEAKRSGRNRVVVARRGNSDAWAAEGGASALHLVWQEGYECGDPTIDAEHRELFRLANSLIDASLREPAEPSVIKAALDELLAHARHHFADEEVILARLHYDQLKEHQRAHAGLIRRAVSMAAQLDAGKAGLGRIVEFLAQDLVARHILAVDRAFFPLIRKAPAVSTRT